jgi:tRNA dimethylallyltransferase
MIYLIGGPTGTGKTSLAITLATTWKAPLINADAFQMYQGMDIGTNKELSRMQGIEHYLFDVISPTQSMSVARYQQEARSLFDRLLKQYPRIIVVGGTGLYMKASVFDFTFSQHESTPDLSEFDSLSDEKLHEYLASIDLESSRHIHPNNRRRVLRAIAIHVATGKTKSEQEAGQKKEMIYPSRWIGMMPKREELYAAIDTRVTKMFQHGLIEEVKTLIARHGDHHRAFQAIGYKEVIQHLKGEQDLPTTIALIQQSTRRYAKRQLTYFRHQFPMQWYQDWQSAAKDILQ